MAEIQGTCSEPFARVREVFDRNLDTGADVGGSVAVFVDGEPVVDLWGGYFDATFTRRWERDTIVHLYSSSKTITSLCALILADRGELDLDAPVAKYWPEFAAEGKGGILVRQLLGHTSALPGWSEPMTRRDLCDWEKSTAALARQAPWWEPGRVSGYEGFNMGHLVGEVVRRVTGKTLGTFLAEEVAGPLGVGRDVYLGTPAECDPRVSLLIQGQPNDVPNGNPIWDRTLFNPHATPHDSWAIEWRRAEIGAVNVHANGRGIATVQAALAAGGANGVRMMSDAGRWRAMEPQSDGADSVFGIPLSWGMGYSLDASLFAGVPASSRIGWWGGNGGSMSFVDLDAGMSLGYAQNHWLGGGFRSLDRAAALINAAYEGLTLSGRIPFSEPANRTPPLRASDFGAFGLPGEPVRL